MGWLLVGLEGARSPRWRVHLLDRDHGFKRVLAGVEGGSVELSAGSSLGGSGVLRLADVSGVDWLTDRVRVFYDPGVPGVAAWAVATMLFASPREIVTASGRFFEVKLLPVTTVLDEDTVSGTFSLAAGVNILEQVRSLIAGVGESTVGVEVSSRVLGKALVWEAGTSKLKIVNELLAAAGFWGLQSDGFGVLLAQPYSVPGLRSPVYVFREGEASVHLPEWERVQDIVAVPNRAIVRTVGSDSKPGIVGVAENTDPGSRFSFQARGRWVTVAETVAELADQQAADQLARRKLVEAMSPVASLLVSHAVLPLRCNDVVVFEDSGYSVRATVQRMSFSLEFGALCSAEWREVNNV